jgi:hypothetical protein
MSARKKKPRSKRVRRVRLRSFIEHEFDSLDLGDERLNKRGRKILGDLYCAPNAQEHLRHRTASVPFGGHMGRKGDAPVGPKVLSRALTKLPVIERMWLIAT